MRYNLGQYGVVLLELVSIPLHPGFGRAVHGGLLIGPLLDQIRIDNPSLFYSFPDVGVWRCGLRWWWSLLVFFTVLWLF